jgi:hypothetical protein
MVVTCHVVQGAPQMVSACTRRILFPLDRTKPTTSPGLCRTKLPITSHWGLVSRIARLNKIVEIVSPQAVLWWLSQADTHEPIAPKQPCVAYLLATERTQTTFN